ncbi:glycosyltransferase [Paracoccus sanguinis]|uniref:glycosyltransferase n=1 Tax=Paracoccus sanguinis TaxID=1545044 RepID=UPI0006911209|nr:glycosyltransferase [Paracoccus sanguinis]
MKTFGHCRFSYFGISDTGRGIKTLEQATEMLWNPARMAVRFHLFENITLPSIRAQTDPDFVVAIISSEAMPTPYRDRLEALVEHDHNIRLIWTNQPSISKASKALMREASNDGRDRALHFRLDDDDALAADYVRQLKRAAEPLEPTSVVSFTSGVMGYLDNGVARHRPFNKLGIAIGLAIVKPPQGTQSPFSIQHLAYTRAHLGHRDDTFVAYHYSRHSTNNTSGYDQAIHDSGPVADAIIANSRQIAPELAGEVRATTETDAAIKAAFPWTDGPTLRRVMEQSLYPETLPGNP